MRVPHVLLLQTWGFWLCFFCTRVDAFAWHKRPPKTNDKSPPHDSPPSGRLVSQILDTESRLPNVYSMTLAELRELESEPLCHRIAARLLIHNCQILDGKNEATVMTDSGRAARDFVDSYAASLAICDLERGNFEIPYSCSKFREASLSRISPLTVPQLHVSTLEIDECLEGLAQSDSAWNTWVSYRHKALRFCEAARAENEKDQKVHLYERVTNILAKLTTEVEAELEARFRSFSDKVQEANDRLDGLTPRVDQLGSELTDLERLIAEDLHQNAHATSLFMRDGMANAKTLESLINTLFQMVQENSANVAESHQSALQESTARVEGEMISLMTGIATIALSSASLQQDIEIFEGRMADIAKQQNKIEAGMERLAGLADGLLQNNEAQERTLRLAQRNAEEVLDTINLLSESATTFQASTARWFDWSGWWPYIVCPTASLVMGSYGLAPSMARNILLIGLGEATGFVIAAVFRATGVHTTTADKPKPPITKDTNPNISTQIYASDSLANEKYLFWV